MLKPVLVAQAFLALVMKIKQPTDRVLVESEYDFIIVGAGTTGSVIANRLSEDSNLRILLLEAGASDVGNAKMSLPMSAADILQTEANWNYPIESQQYTYKFLPNRTFPWPRGKVLGGSSSINGMHYIRGSPHDYDSWESHGATGWGWQQVEPYFRKFEGATDEGTSKRMGRDGPLKITKRYASPMHYRLVDTAEQLGIKKVDYHDEMEGVSFIYNTVYKGIRQSAAVAFLHPVIPERKERLHVVPDVHVTKILFDQTSIRTKATGVTFVEDGQMKIVRARKEVILSAGVIGTPQLLMLSGIGPKNHLQKFKIESTADMSGVGSNLQDHECLLLFYHTTNMPPNYVTSPDVLKQHLAEYVINGTGPWVTPFGVDTNINIRTGADDISASSSKHPFTDFQIIFANAANETAPGVAPQDPDDDRTVSFIVVICQAHPKSRGTIQLKADDPFQYPAIDPKYFSHEDDVSLFMEGIRYFERFEMSELFREIGAELILPPYCKEFQSQNPPRSKGFYRCLLRNMIMSLHHPCCTAKMGSPDDEDAVVDHRLRVYGVDNLRIADASVMPHLTSANLQAPCYMIGEKASDMIKEDWKITA